MPPKTRPVPTQWRKVKLLLKYQMEKRRLMNFLVVRTRLAVRLVHSVVRTNTEVIVVSKGLRRMGGWMIKYEPMGISDVKSLYLK